jgi:hypothetical protein
MYRLVPRRKETYLTPFRIQAQHLKPVGAELEDRFLELVEYFQNPRHCNSNRYSKTTPTLGTWARNLKGATSCTEKERHCL